MRPGPDHAAPLPRVTNGGDAERLIADVLATMGDLERLIEEETAHVRAGRIRQGLAREERKSELSGAYMRGLEAVKANAVALARFAPDRLDRLRSAHAGFSRVIETNQAVLATARAISEGLVKGLADEIGRTSRPQSYGPARSQPPRPPRAEPLIVSKSL